MHGIRKKSLSIFLSYSVHHIKSIPSIITSQTSHILKAKKTGTRSTAGEEAFSSQTLRNEIDRVNEEQGQEGRHKVILIGNSHARGCASELKQTLVKSYKVEGYVKPGASVSVLVNTAKEEMNMLTKEDIVIF